MSLIWPVLATIILVDSRVLCLSRNALRRKRLLSTEFVTQQPPFWLPYFLLVLVGAIAITVFYYSQLGLASTGHRAQAVRCNDETAVVVWLGAVLTLFFWWLMVGRVTIFGSWCTTRLLADVVGFHSSVGCLTYRRTVVARCCDANHTFLIVALVSYSLVLLRVLRYFVLSNCIRQWAHK